MTAATELVNIRDPSSRYTVYIGRENPRKGLQESKWANPFHIGKDGNRQQVISKYRKHIEDTPKLLESIGELEGETLGCYCAPLPCHGDVLIQLIHERKQQ